jgi:hypothetical protein
MGKRYPEGRARALEAIGRHGPDGISALAIGNAVVAGTRRRHHMRRNDKEALGLAIAARLVHARLVVATRNNRFRLAQYKGQMTPPPITRHYDPQERGTFGAASRGRVLVRDGVEVETT